MCAAVGVVVDADVENVVCLLGCPGRLHTAASVASSLKRSAYMSHGCQSVFAQGALVVVSLSVVVGVVGRGSRRWKSGEVVAMSNFLVKYESSAKDQESFSP